MKLPAIILAAVLMTASLEVFAHGPASGPHGGPMVDAGPYHTELVVQNGEVALYVNDSDGKPMDVAGAKAEATILIDKKAQKVTLQPASGNILKGQADVGSAHSGMKAVATLTMPGQKAIQARFDFSHTSHTAAQMK